MDEEDLAEAAEKQTLQTHESFAGLGTSDQDERHPNAVLDLFRPQNETIGVQLLRKMGWRDGQGIGPKLRRRAIVEEHGNDAETGQHTFAPTNSKMIQFNRKDDRKGLGYQTEARLGGQHNPRIGEDSEEDSVSVIKPRIQSKSGKQTYVPRPAAFGVGVLNDDGSDDEDPYSTGPRISYNKTIGGHKKNGPSTGTKSVVVKGAAKPLGKSKQGVLVKKTQVSDRVRKCHDGRVPLHGFLLAQPLASLSLGEDDRFAPPTVPDDWQPLNRVLQEGVAQTMYQSTADVTKASQLDAKGRAEILGETQLPGKSVFDFMSAAARNRLAASSKNEYLPPGRGEKGPAAVADNTNTTEVDIPSVDKRTAQEALRRGAVASLRNADESKRRRFESYLQYQAELRNAPPSATPQISGAQWATELDEFMKAARAFKPMSGLMASRFTSAGVSKPSDDSLKQELSHRPAKPKDAAEEAASMGMFGPMTRSQHHFMPTRLVCKRFNVRLPPHVDGPESNPPSMTSSVAGSAKELVSSETLERMRKEQPLPFTQHSPTLEVRGTAEIRLEPQAESTECADIDASRNEALESERACEEVFRAVFGDEDSDS